MIKMKTGTAVFMLFAGLIGVLGSGVASASSTTEGYSGGCIEVQGDYR
jgi:hypothetical protein